MKTGRIWCAVLAASVFAATAHAESRYHLPHIVNGSFDGGSFRTTFVLFNNTNVEAVASLRLILSSGAPFKVSLGNLGTGDEFQIRVAAGATHYLQTDGSGVLLSGAASVTSTSSLGVSAIFTVYGRDGGYLTESGVTASEPAAEFVLPVDTTAAFNTGLALFNPSSGDAALTLSLLGADGRELASTALTLSAGGQVARFIAGPGQLFPEAGSMQGTLKVQSTIPVSALALRQNQEPLSYTSIPVVTAGSAKSMLHLAHVANGTFSGGSYRTSFLILNPSSVSANVTLFLTNNFGGPLPLTIAGIGTQSTFNLPTLPAGGSLFLQTDGAKALVSGAARISSDVPIGAAAIFSVFDDKGKFLTEAGVGDSATGKDFTLPVDISGNFSTGVALFNTGDSSAWVTVNLLDEDGIRKAHSKLLSIPSKGHTAEFVSQIFEGLSEFTGSISFIATEELAAVSLRQNLTPLSYTTLPVAAGSAPVRTLYLDRKVVSGLAVEEDLAADATLAPCFTVSGSLIGNWNEVSEITAVSVDGTVFPAGLEFSRYHIRLGAGTYTLKVVRVLESLLITYTDPTPVVVSGNMTRDIPLPAVSRIPVSGTISGFGSLPLQRSPYAHFSLRDEPHSVGWFPVDPNGAFSGSLPPGEYRLNVVFPYLSFAEGRAQYLTLYEVGSAIVGNSPVTVNCTIPPLYRLTGMVRGGGPLLDVTDATVWAADTAMGNLTWYEAPNESDASVDTTGKYEMLLAADRSYALMIVAPVKGGGGLNFPAGLFEPASGSIVRSSVDTTHDFNVPELPAFVTLSGRVTDQRGQGVDGVAIVAESWLITGAPGVAYVNDTSSDINGYYQLSVLMGTDYRLAFVPPTWP